MSLDSIITQAREHEYRARTQTDKAMAGVTAPNFRCKKCKEFRNTKGRKKVTQGYLCSRCATLIQEAQKAKEAKENSNE